MKISVPTRLPELSVPQATPPATQDGILDSGSFAGDADVVMPAWWFALKGQCVWVTATGTRVNGETFSIPVYTAHTLTPDEVAAGLRGVLKRVDLVELKHLSELTLRGKVTLNPGALESEAIPLAPLRLRMRFELKQIEERFEQANLQVYSAGGVSQVPTMKVTFVSGAEKQASFATAMTVITRARPWCYARISAISRFPR
ncbi:hypothetical protein ACLIN3_19410 [Pseudomonas orientalis]|uniref:hypothetical protein n=1 Tax=Pseudomonas orientalis TaxID=76758 RepID=UPI003985A675